MLNTYLCSSAQDECRRPCRCDVTSFAAATSRTDAAVLVFRLGDYWTPVESRSLPCRADGCSHMTRRGHLDHSRLATTRPPADAVTSPVIRRRSSDARNTASGAMSVTHSSGRAVSSRPGQRRRQPHQKVPAVQVLGLSVPGRDGVYADLGAARVRAPNTFVSVSMAPFVDT